MKRPQNVVELRKALLEEWEKIDQRVINSLIDSMPRRIGALLDTKGSSIKYYIEQPIKACSINY